MVGNSTCPSSVAFGQDIADLGVTARTQQAMVNSLEYKTLEDQARSQHEASIYATLSEGQPEPEPKPVNPKTRTLGKPSGFLLAQYRDFHDPPAAANVPARMHNDSIGFIHFLCLCLLL